MLAFLIGLTVGFIICIPIGPLNVVVVNLYLTKGYRPSISAALGGSMLDLVYLFVILSGISLFTLSEELISALKVLGILFLLIFGIYEFTKEQQVLELKEVKTIKGTTLLKYFFAGAIVYISNPVLVVTMTGIGTFLKSLAFFEFSQFNILLLSVGLALGTFSWFIFLVEVVKRYESKIRDRFLHKANKVSGLLLIFFSAVLGIKAFI